VTREEMRERVAGTFAKSEYSVPLDMMGVTTRHRLLRSADAAIALVLGEAAKACKAVASEYSSPIGPGHVAHECAAAICALGEKPNA
jgi:hypothetical protein